MTTTQTVIYLFYGLQLWMAVGALFFYSIWFVSRMMIGPLDVTMLAKMFLLWPAYSIYGVLMLVENHRHKLRQKTNPAPSGDQRAGNDGAHPSGTEPDGNQKAHCACHECVGRRAGLH